MSKLGLARGEVYLEKNYTMWKKEYSKEYALLIHYLGDLQVQIEHIGSTSVKDIPAKPIIDIMIGVGNFDGLNIVVSKLVSHGYEFRENGSRPGNLLVVKGSPQKRTHYIHIVIKNSEFWKEYIIFRNQLRDNKSLCKKYSNLKIELSQKHKHNRGKYTELKSAFVKQVISQAR